MELLSGRRISAVFLTFSIVLPLNLAATLLFKETFTHTGNHFYSNSSHVLEEISAPTSEDITGFCSRKCIYNLQCNGFELCSLAGGSEKCRLTNGADKGSLTFQTGEICRYYHMVSKIAYNLSETRRGWKFRLTPQSKFSTLTNFAEITLLNDKFIFLDCVLLPKVTSWLLWTKVHWTHFRREQINFSRNNAKLLRINSN